MKWKKYGWTPHMWVFGTACGALFDLFSPIGYNGIYGIGLAVQDSDDSADLDQRAWGVGWVLLLTFDGKDRRKTMVSGQEISPETYPLPLLDII